MGDMLSDFPHRSELGVDQHIGLAIKRGTLGQQSFNLRPRLRIVQQGAVGLVPDSLPDGIGAGPQTDDQRMGPEFGEVVTVGREPASRRDDRTGATAELIDDLAFQLTEAGFAFETEDLRDRALTSALDEFVGVQHLKMQQTGQDMAHGRLARAHEPN